MISYPRLLAKSTNLADPAAEATLQGHTAAVVSAMKTLLRLRGEHVLVAMGMEATLLPRLRSVAMLAAYMHDLGKCSEHFQGMIYRRREVRQLIRHEAMSLWLCWPGQPLCEWLCSGGASDEDVRLAAMAAAGHHRKFWQGAIAPEGAGAGLDIQLMLGHADFAALLRAGQRMLGLAEPPECVDIVVPAKSFAKQLSDYKQELDDDPVDDDNERLLAAIKGLLIAADVAGSALVRGSDTPKRWIAEQLQQRASSADLAQLVQRRLGTGKLRGFQDEVGASSAMVTFVRAGCGSGKTLAAYHWAAKHHAGRQLWVTYPTTGTATEGFRDYIVGSDLPGELLHGRSQVDVAMLGLDELEGEHARDFFRVEALRAWGAPVVVGTVDALLGLLQNQRRGLYAFPAIAHAAVVFDEIHAYDDTLFDFLLEFLRTFPGTPALLMTASLPERRLRRVRDVVTTAQGMPLREIDGPADLESLSRYRVRFDEQPKNAVSETLKAGGKVLWVSNTVNRCIAAADSMAGHNPLIYHSRFRYEDRVQRHADAIAAFQKPGPALLCSTQVAEMSLDLSADLLVTDLAPVPALIQRMGRLNRRSTPEAPAPLGSALVCGVPRPAPYEQAELDDAAGWLESLSNRPLSQADLIAAWDQRPEDAKTVARRPGAWLHGQLETTVGALREPSPGITVLLEQDRGAVVAGSTDPLRAALPMPQPRDATWSEWPRVGYLPVAPESAVDYDPKRGAQWR